jgi:hypothetical protein
MLTKMSKKNNQNKENVVMWQKWLDPFGEDDIIESDFDKETNDNFLDEDIEEDLQEGSLQKEKNKLDNIINISNKHIKVIATPMGIVPVNENTCSGKIFNFWVGHTNFDITRNIAAIIELTQGVETLDVFTRYRFRISIGKAFNDSAVMRMVNKNVYNYLE